MITLNDENVESCILPHLKRLEFIDFSFIDVTYEGYFRLLEGLSHLKTVYYTQDYHDDETVWNKLRRVGKKKGVVMIQINHREEISKNERRLLSF